MSGEITISVNGVPEVDDAMRAWMVDHEEHVKRATLRAAVECEAHAKRSCPVDLGHLRASIKYRPTDDGYGADVYTDVAYAAYVEYGTRPHMPPVDALRAWAASHGINPWALAMHIKKYGTREHPYMRPAWDAVKESYYRDLAEAMR